MDGDGRFDGATNEDLSGLPETGTRSVNAPATRYGGRRLIWAGATKRDPKSVSTSRSRTTDAIPCTPRFPIHRRLFALLNPRQQRNTHRTHHQPADHSEQTESDFPYPRPAHHRVVSPGNAWKHRRNTQAVVSGRLAIRLCERNKLFVADVRGGRTRVHRRPGRLPRRIVLLRLSHAIAEEGARLPCHTGFAISQRHLTSLDNGGDVRPRTSANEDGRIDRGNCTRQHKEATG